MFRSLVLLFTIFFAVLFAVPLDLDEDMTDATFIFMIGFSMGECKSELKLKKGDLVSLFKDDETKMPENVKCFIKCTMEGIGLFKNGKLMEKKALKWIEKDRKENATLADQEMMVFNACKDISSKDKCGTEAKVFICCRDNYEKIGISVL